MLSDSHSNQKVEDIGMKKKRTLILNGEDYNVDAFVQFLKENVLDKELDTVTISLCNSDYSKAEDWTSLSTPLKDQKIINNFFAQRNMPVVCLRNLTGKQINDFRKNLRKHIMEKISCCGKKPRFILHYSGHGAMIKEHPEYGLQMIGIDGTRSGFVKFTTGTGFSDAIRVIIADCCRNAIEYKKMEKKCKISGNGSTFNVFTASLGGVATATVNMASKLSQNIEEFGPLFAVKFKSSFIDFIDHCGSAANAFREWQGPTQDLSLHSSKAVLLKEFEQIDPQDIIKTLQRINHLLKSAENGNVVLVIGDTGAGKSTIMNAICYGSESLEMTIKEVPSTRNSKRMRKKKLIDLKEHYKQLSKFPIGHSNIVSCTSTPNILIKKNTVYVDAAGFNDSNGIQNELINCMAIRKVIHVAKSVRIVYALTAYSVTESGGRGGAVRQAIDTLAQFFRKPFHNFIDSITILITKAEVGTHSDDLVEDLLLHLKSKSSKVDQVIHTSLAERLILCDPLDREMEGDRAMDMCKVGPTILGTKGINKPSKVFKDPFTKAALNQIRVMFDTYKEVYESEVEQICLKIGTQLEVDENATFRKEDMKKSDVMTYMEIQMKELIRLGVPLLDEVLENVSKSWNQAVKEMTNMGEKKHLKKMAEQQKKIHEQKLLEKERILREQEENSRLEKKKLLERSKKEREALEERSRLEKERIELRSRLEKERLEERSRLEKERLEERNRLEKEKLEEQSRLEKEFIKMTALHAHLKQMTEKTVSSLKKDCQNTYLNKNWEMCEHTAGSHVVGGILTFGLGTAYRQTFHGEAVYSLCGPYKIRRETGEGYFEDILDKLSKKYYFRVERKTSTYEKMGQKTADISLTFYCKKTCVPIVSCCWKYTWNKKDCCSKILV